MPQGQRRDQEPSRRQGDRADLQQRRPLLSSPTPPQWDQPTGVPASIRSGRPGQYPTPSDDSPLQIHAPLRFTIATKGPTAAPSQTTQTGADCLSGLERTGVHPATLQHGPPVNCQPIEHVLVRQPAVSLLAPITPHELRICNAPAVSTPLGFLLSISIEGTQPPLCESCAGLSGRRVLRESRLFDLPHDREPGNAIAVVESNRQSRSREMAGLVVGCRRRRSHL